MREACLWSHARRYASREEEDAETSNGESTAATSIADCGREHVLHTTEEDTSHQSTKGMETGIKNIDHRVEVELFIRTGKSSPKSGVELDALVDEEA